MGHSLAIPSYYPAMEKFPLHCIAFSRYFLSKVSYSLRHIQQCMGELEVHNINSNTESSRAKLHEPSECVFLSEGRLPHEGKLLQISQMVTNVGIIILTCDVTFKREIALQCRHVDSPLA